MSGFLDKKSKVKTVYQSDGENLVRRNFRPNNVDWLEFGLLADFLGVSKCALFVMLLSLEVGDGDPQAQGKNKIKEVPSDTFNFFQLRGIFREQRERYINRIRGKPKKKSQN